MKTQTELSLHGCSVLFCLWLCVAGGVRTHILMLGNGWCHQWHGGGGEFAFEHKSSRQTTSKYQSESMMSRLWSAMGWLFCVSAWDIWASLKQDGVSIDFIKVISSVSQSRPLCLLQDWLVICHVFWWTLCPRSIFYKIPFSHKLQKRQSHTPGVGRLLRPNNLFKSRSVKPPSWTLTSFIGVNFLIQFHGLFHEERLPKMCLTCGKW